MMGLFQVKQAFFFVIVSRGTFFFWFFNNLNFLSLTRKNISANALEVLAIKKVLLLIFESPLE